MTTDKLIKQYNEKLSAIDKQLVIILDQIREKRRVGEDYNYLLNERLAKEDIRQVYFQMVKDLEDLE